MAIEVKMVNRKGYKLTPEQACRKMKRKLEEEGVFDELKSRRSFVKKSDKRRKEEEERKRTVRQIQKRKG